MNIKRTPVNVERVDRLCELCGGIMKPTAQPTNENPPRYEHTCPKCGHIEMYRQPYPTYVYTEREADND